MNSSSFHWPFAVSAILAATVFWIYGSALLRRLVPQQSRALPATSILLGQMALWFASYLLLPLSALMQSRIGISPAISFVLWAGALAIALERFRHRERPIDFRRGFAAPTSIPILAGATALIAVAQIYGPHLGALGLDTHQHIYWSNQILDAGHLPLIERGTSVLSLYPKAFHLLVALYSAAGLGEFVGPWVKLMPFLQAFLSCLVFAELCIQLADQREGQAAHGRLVAVVLTTALLVYAFTISRMVFPEYDLNGTPRIASGAALYFPYLLWLAGLILESAALRRIAWLCLPATALLLLALNAVLVIQLIILVIPLMLVTHYIFRRGDRGTAGPPGETASRTSFAPSPAVAAIALLPAIAIALGDPWIVALWSKFAWLPGDAYLQLQGIVAPGQAADLGLISRDELVADAISHPQVTGLYAMTRLFFDSLFEAGRLWLGGLGWQFPFRGDVFSDTGRVVLRLTMAGSVALALFARKWGNSSRSHSEHSLALGIWSGVTLVAVFGGFTQIASWKFAEGLAQGRGYEFVLLSDYLEVAPLQVGLIAQGIWLLAGLAWALSAVRVPQWMERTLAGVALPLALAACLPLLLARQVVGFDPERSFWTPVDHRDLANLREIEEHIEEWEGILVPASAWEIGGEKWIIPQGATASLLPYATRRYFFNSRLGAGVQFNWRDFARFCNAGRAERAAFLTRNDIRWLLINAPIRAAEPFFRRFRICNLHLAELGASYPPAERAGELLLFHLDPDRLSDNR